VSAGRIKTIFGTACMRRIMVACLALVTLVGLTRGTQDAVANGDTRTLEIIQMHTGERVSVTFRRNGRYDRRGLEQLNWVMRDWRRDEATEMDPRLYDLLWEVHRSTGSRQPVHVVSAYRAPQTNEALRRRSRNVAQQSQHTVGKAVDFYLPDVPAERIRTLGLRMQRGGVGYYPRANTPFVHLDTGSVRHWPRMNRQQLVNLFPDQRTVHIPSDGKPLAGFDQARREVLAAGGTVMGETGTATASRAPQGRSFWARLFGGGEDSDQDMAEAQALSDNGWVNPASHAARPQRGAAPLVASRQASPQPRASTPQPRASAPAPAPEQVPLPPVVTERAPAPEPEPAPAETVIAQSEAIPLPPPRPTSLVASQERPRDSAPVESGPRMVWSPGPSGIAVPGAASGRPVDTATDDAERVEIAQDQDGQSAGEVRLAGFTPPLPPPRPGVPGESIGAIVSAFASTDNPAGTGDALAQMGLRAPSSQQREEERVASLAIPLPPLPEAERATARDSITQAAISEPEATASTTRRNSTGQRPAENLLAAARDPAASYYTLFNTSASATVPSNGARARIAAVQARPVERSDAAPDAKARGFVGGADIGLAGRFAAVPSAPAPGAFNGRAVAPLPPRP
jgi:uncharacterized protein YcbK (DUF882 family)